MEEYDQVKSDGGKGGGEGMMREGRKM